MTLKQAAPVAPRYEASNGGGGREKRDSHELLAVAILIAIPTVVFVAADAFGGHLLLSGDDLLQNYPLRVLVGSDLRGGYLPFWNPYIWSGTPLLAGLNAGAFYPATFLFAFLSTSAAWVIGQILIYSSVSVGTFVLFRSGGTSIRASFLGAFSFAFAGAVLAQSSVHLDMADGLASLPWAVFAIRRIGDDGRWRWAVVLGAAFGLAVLGGSPEALLDTAALCATFALLRWSTRCGTWWIYLSRIGTGAALALGSTALVWLPALHSIASSQRQGGGSYFASTFSFPPFTSVLAFVPYLEGGYSLFSQPQYFGQNNLEEVGFYVGILPVIATFTLLIPAWRRRIPGGELRCWYGVLLVGGILAVGEGTPLEHILYHIPFYGSQRDSGRNIVVVDLAACALFAWWVDGGVERRRQEGRAVRARADLAVAVLPFIVVALVGLGFVVSPSTLWLELRAIPPPGAGAAGSGAAIVMAACIAGAGAILVFLRGRVRAAAWVKWVTVFVVADVGLFTLGSGYASAQQLPVGSNEGPVVSLIRANLSPGGRYGVFDADLYDQGEFADAGEPDLGILEGLPSVSGYGSITDSQYASLTGTQNRGLIDRTPLEEGLLDQLGLQVIVTLPESFIVPIQPLSGLKNTPSTPGTPATSAQKSQNKVLSEPPGKDPALPGGDSPPLLPPPYTLTSAPPRTTVPSGDASEWWFGTTLRLSDALVELGTPSQGQTIEVSALSSSGTVAWSAPLFLGTGVSTAILPIEDQGADGIALKLVSGPALESVRIAAVTPAGRYYLVDGPLSNAVVPGQWRQVGAAGGFTVFRATYLPQQAWLQAPGSTSVENPPPGPSEQPGDARVVSTTPNSVTIDVTASSAALLVWSTGWDAGWRAQRVDPDRSSSLKDHRIGLVQGVDVPSGASTIRFTYEPQGFPLGSALTTATFGVFLATLALVYAARRRRVLATQKVHVELPQGA